MRRNAGVVEWTVLGDAPKRYISPLKRAYQRNYITYSYIIGFMICAIFAAILLAFISPFFSYGNHGATQVDIEGMRQEIDVLNDVLIPPTPPTPARRRQVGPYTIPLTLPNLREVYVNASEYYHRGEILSLTHLFDVDITIPVDDYILGYDAGSCTWMPRPNLNSLSNLTDVNLFDGGAAVDSVLFYNASNTMWTSSTIADFFETHITLPTLEELGVKHNFAGIANPTTQDDDVDGYHRGSMWITQGTLATYLCVDATEGAAQWERMDLYEGAVASFHVQDGTLVEDDMDSSYHKRVPSGIGALDPFGKLYVDQLPDLAITDVTAVLNIAERDAILNPQEGNIAVVQQANAFNQTITFIYDGASWVQLQSSSDVLLVNGQIGTVQLFTEDIPESPSALYYTDSRVTAHPDVTTNTAHSAIISGNPHGLTPTHIGLSNVLNTLNNFAALGPPTANNDVSEGYTVGSEWVIPSLNCVFQCTDNVLGAAMWVRLDLPDMSVTSAKLVDGSVIEQKIGSGAVTTDKLADASVTSVKLAPSAVITTNIADGAVTTAKLADNSVVATKIAVEAVHTVALHDSAVTSDKMATNAVTTDKLVDDAVTTVKVVDGSITSAKILDGTVAAIDMVSGYQKGIPSGLASLDASGMIFASQLPPISVVSVTVVANITERDALVAQEGDFALVQDADGMGNPATFALSSTGWVELAFTADVSSVNGQINNVMLSTDDIPEGSTLYFTQTRVSENSDVSTNSAHSALTSGNPHSVSKSDLGIGNVQNTLHMVSPSSSPIVTSDHNAGYNKGSTWVNTATGGAYMCVDDSAGAAMWKRLDTADGSITQAKIATDAVRSTHILDGEVGSLDIDSTQVQERVTGTCPSDEHLISINVNGGVQCSDTIKVNTVGNTQLVDGSVSTAKLAAGAVTGPKMASSSVSSVHVVDGSIVAVDVDASEIQKRVVGTCATAGYHMRTIAESGGVTCDNVVAAGTVSSAQIQDGSILEVDYADASISLAKLQPGSVDSTKVLDDTLAEVDMSAAYKKRVANGVAALDGTGKLYVDQIPTLGTSVFVVTNYTARDVITGMVSGDTCIVTGTSETFIYDGAAWIVLPTTGIADTDSLPEGSTNLYYTNTRVSANSDVTTNSAHAAIVSGNPHGITKATVGLSLVQNVRHAFTGVAPTVTDDASLLYTPGSVWLDHSDPGGGGAAYVCIDNTLGAAQWKRLDVYPASISELELKSSAVTGVKIAAGAVSTTQINAATVQRRVSGTCTGGAKISAVAQDGTVTCDSSIPNNAVGGAQIADGSVDSADIAGGAIIASKIATGAVTSTGILDGTVAKIDVDSTEVQERVVGTCSAGQHFTGISQAGGATCDSTVAVNSVGTTQIVDGSVGSGDIGAGAVVLGKLATASVQNSNLVDNTILEAKMGTPYKRGVANGVATLNAFGVIPLAQIPLNGPVYTEITATLTKTTASSTYVIIPSMTITPAVGTYHVSFSASSSHTDASDLSQYAIYKGSTIAHSERNILGSGGAQMDGVSTAMHTQAVVTVTGSEAIEIQWKTAGADLTVYERSMFLWKIA